LPSLFCLQRETAKMATKKVGREEMELIIRAINNP
jgi:hypothetical protein